MITLNQDNRDKEVQKALREVIEVIVEIKKARSDKKIRWREWLEIADEALDLKEVNVELVAKELKAMDSKELQAVKDKALAQLIENKVIVENANTKVISDAADVIIAVAAALITVDEVRA